MTKPTRNPQNTYHALCIALLLVITSIACRPADAYEARYAECFQEVKTVEFEIEGSTKKGIGYSGFDTRCLLGARLPQFNATDISGKEINSGDLEGKPTVINFWFIKCAPCVAEIPRLNALLDKYDRQQVNYLAFSRDARDEIEAFLKIKPFRFTNIPDAQDIIEENFHLLWGYPSTIVTDQSGKIVEIFEGATLKSDPSVDVTTAVDALLAELLMR